MWSSNSGQWFLFAFQIKVSESGSWSTNIFLVSFGINIYRALAYNFLSNSYICFLNFCTHIFGLLDEDFLDAITFVSKYKSYCNYLKKKNRHQVKKNMRAKIEKCNYCSENSKQALCTYTNIISMSHHFSCLIFLSFISSDLIFIEEININEYTCIYCIKSYTYTCIYVCYYWWIYHLDWLLPSYQRTSLTIFNNNIPGV